MIVHGILFTVPAEGLHTMHISLSSSVRLYPQGSERECNFISQGCLKYSRFISVVFFPCEIHSKSSDKDKLRHNTELPCC